ncbi:GTP pyrophosphokinase family protein [Populibacterium corticicola]|uniref:GTP pyrophosphokinase family protein n=1 Tax=Populibacterium corticicola TaxID=1812826 RepID=A0ABW5XJ10_9MICO
MVNPQPQDLQAMRREMSRMFMHFKFGMDEVLTKINILREEFAHVHDYNPIESVSSRIKSPDSVLEKIQRKGCSYSHEDLSTHVRDIAGIRVTCSFVKDIYRIRDLLLAQRDITLVDERDYVSNPKSNGYSSLHLIVTVPVFLSTGPKDVMVEVQIRTIAMDFWASLEHKIYYKYHGKVPMQLDAELKLAADIATRLDYKMQELKEQVDSLALEDPEAPSRKDEIQREAIDRLLRFALESGKDSASKSADYEAEPSRSQALAQDQQNAR